MFLGSSNLAGHKVGQNENYRQACPLVPQVRRGTLQVIEWFAYLLVFGLLIESVSAETGSSDHAKEKLAFVANLDGNWDLFIADIDGTNRKRLTETPYDEADPVWSPDRRNIAFSGTDGYLRVVNLTTGEVGEYKPDSEEMRYRQPSYSPDASKIALSIHYRGTIDRTDLGVLSLADTTLDIPVPENSLQLFPSWSPDGETIYYVKVTCNVGCGRIIQEVWSLPWPEGFPKQELLTNSHCQSPDLSPDGTELVFSSNQGGSFDLWKHSYATGETVRLTYDPALDIGPSWSKGGATVAFTSTRDAGFGIYILNVKSGEIKPFRPFGDEPIECKNPDF